MKRQINKVAVLGAGVMGATIAAHLTNTGVQVVMLDIVPSEPNDAEKAAGLTTADKKVRNRYAADGLAGLLKMKPAPFLLKSYASYITVGNLEDDIELLKDCDWVMECVIENMQIKENLFKNKIVPNFKPGAILSTNTSGLSINALAKTLPPEIAKNFLVTHYFNPPRYMRLMELVACDQTDPETFAFMADWLNVRQGKGIVYGKDTPNFISNRIGTYAGANAGMYMEKLDFTVEEVDLLTGSVIARPKMASFALGDLVGVDTIERIYDNTYRLLEGIDEDRDVFVVSNCVREMVKKGLTGNKVKKGYYKKEKVEGKNVKFVLNWKTVEYEPCVKPTFESVTAAMAGKTPAERLGKFIREGNDRAAEFGWKNVRDTMIYAAKRIPEISNDVINIDNAMKWGYNWELGPFECLDAIGVPYFVERCEKDGVSFPAYLKDVKAFYAVVDGKDCYYDIPTKKYVAIPMADTNVSLTVLKRGNKTVGGNEAASVIDLGDGVFCVEYHTKSNAISPEVLTVINQGIAIAEKEGKALVLANNGPMFSAGADLSQLAKGIEAGAWDQLLAGVKSFQDAMMNIKYSKIPVVAAPHQMALGGGCESCIHADAIVPHAETTWASSKSASGSSRAAAERKKWLFAPSKQLPRLTPMSSRSS